MKGKTTVKDKEAAALCKIRDQDRGRILSELWGTRRVSRLNRILDVGYCGALTVRELAAIALADRVNFPRGLDTPVAIGDFEGNFSTGVLSVTVAGSYSDHMCITGDPNRDSLR